MHVGCGDGRLTAELLRDGVQIVQGVAADASSVAAARRHIRSEGRYGQVSVFQGSLKRLPYSDDLVNVTIVDDLPAALAAGFTIEEGLRVLAPHGTALFGGMPGGELAGRLDGAEVIALTGGEWARYVKPYPDEMDEWPQFLHDAAHTRISQDRRVGPATGFQWIQGGFFATSAYPSRGIVSANGRNFYVTAPSGPSTRNTGSMHVLEARDAFNGLKLWERPVYVAPSRKVWFSNRTSTVIAAGDMVFAQLEKDGPIVALDAATGQVVRTYDVRGDLNYCDGRLIVRQSSNVWTVVEPDSGEKLRSFEVKGSYHSSPMLIWDGKAFVLEAGQGELDRRYRDEDPSALWWQAVKDGSRHARGEIVCFDFRSGHKLWQAPNVGDGRLYWARRGLLMTRRHDSMNAFSAEDGKHLWSKPMTTKKGGFSAAFYLGDYVWGHGTARWYYAYDPRTGDLVKRDPGRAKEFGRCGPDLATERYILGQDLSLYDMQNTRTYNTFFTRGDCGVNYMPANGMYYQYGQVCRCMTYVPGIQGVSTTPLAEEQEMRGRAGDPFERGPAFGRAAASRRAAAGDWPALRHDPARSGATTTAVPAELAPFWKTRLGAPLSAPVVADGTAYVACVDQHRVVALDTADGSVRWDYTAGGRVDSPPTVHEGLVLFGSRDGWAYCLRASDGQLAWRRRVAPEDRMICVRGQLESVWPLFGAALVQDNVAYFAAGRHGDADGGVFFCAAEPATGKVLWQANLRGFPPYRSDPHACLIEARVLRKEQFDEQKLQSAAQDLLSGIPAAFRNDVLTSNGRTVFLNALGIDIQSRQPDPAPRGRALFTPVATLLSDNSQPSYTTRNQWSYVGADDRRGWRHDNRARLTGHLLAIAADRAFGTRGADELFATALNPSAKSWRLREPGGARIKALVAAGDKVFAACRRPAGESDAEVGKVYVYSAEDGRRLADNPLGGLPVFDGMAATQGRLFVSTEGGELVCMGPFFRLVERDRTFASGARVTRTLAFSRDATPAYPFEIRWSLSVDGRTVREATKAFGAVDNLPERLAIALDLPRVDERTAGEFTVALHRDGGEVFRDVNPLFIINPDAARKPKVAASDLCIWDPSGTAKERLSERAVEFTEVTDFKAIPGDAKVVVVGRDALTRVQGHDEKWRELATAGGRILFLEQQSPLAPQIVDADFYSYESPCLRATIGDPGHACLDGLMPADLAHWSGDGVVCRRPFAARRREFRSPIMAGDGRESGLGEFPVGDGLILICQLAVGEKLPTSPVAQRMFDNMLNYCVEFRPRSVALAMDEDSAEAEFLRSVGLDCDHAADVLNAISDHNIVIANAAPETLERLARDPDALRAFAERGGWLMLWGLTPDGLSDFNRIVGVEHMLRPFGMERVSLPEESDPLTEGLSPGDLDISSAERYGYLGECWPAADAYSYVVDYDDVAPFCKLPGPEYWRCPGGLKMDRWPGNMVNGMWDFWRAGFVFGLDLGAPTRWTMELPAEQEIIGFSIIPDVAYNKLRRIRLSFDGAGAEPVTFDLSGEPVRRTVEFAARKARKVDVEILEWDADVTNPILGVDNLWLRARRPDDFFEKVRPLADIGVLVKYPSSGGGIILNQVRLLSDEEVAAQVTAAGEAAAKQAKEDKEQAREKAERKVRSHLESNRAKKGRIVRRLLWNLGVPL